MADFLRRIVPLMLCIAGLAAPAMAADVTMTFSGQAQLDAAGLGTSFCTWNLKAATLVVNGVPIH